MTTLPEVIELLKQGRIGNSREVAAGILKVLEDRPEMRLQVQGNDMNWLRAHVQARNEQGKWDMAQRFAADAERYARDWNRAPGKIPARDMEAAGNALVGSGQVVAWNGETEAWQTAPAEIFGGFSGVIAGERRWGGFERYEAKRAPVGGVSIKGQFYPGGQWIPAEVIAGATPAEKAAVAGGGQAGGAKPAGGVDVSGGVKPTGGINLPGPGQKYHDAAMENLRKTSRTAQGTVDTSASKNKADKMQVGSGAQAAQLAQENFGRTMHWLHDNRKWTPKNADEMMDFMDTIVKSINKGITKEGVLHRTEDSHKWPYTSADKIPYAKRQFAQELLDKLDSEDPRKLAAWVHWRANFADHFYADGVGKSTEALADWVLMRHDQPLPQFRSRDEVFENAARTQVDPHQGGEGYRGKEFDKWHDYFRGLFPEPHHSEFQGTTEEDARKFLSQVDMHRWGSVEEPNAPEDAEAWLKALEDNPIIQTAAKLVASATPTEKTYRNADGTWHPDRQKIHREFQAGILTPETKAASGTRPQLVLLLGPPGSGKSYAGRPIAKQMEQAFGGKFAEVDADAAKAALPEYRGWNAGQLHEESSHMVEGPSNKEFPDSKPDGVIYNGMKGRHHMILDMTGANGSKMKMFADMAHKRGYDVHVVGVKFPSYRSMARAANRFLKNPFDMRSHDAKGKRQELGRYVPPGYAHKKVDGKPEVTYQELKDHPAVKSWKQVSTADQDPSIVDAGDKLRQPAGAQYARWSHPDEMWTGLHRSPSVFGNPYRR